MRVRVRVSCGGDGAPSVTMRWREMGRPTPRASESARQPHHGPLTEGPGCLHPDERPSTCAWQVRSVETVIQLAFRLKQAVGSYALMHGSGFEHTDGMQVAKFAEGESFVLLQKMARDRVRMADPPAGNVSAEEAAICSKLRGARASEWLAASDQVYLLAELLMDRTMEHLVGGAPPRGVARPFAKL